MPPTMPYVYPIVKTEKLEFTVAGCWESPPDFRKVKAQDKAEKKRG